MCTVYKDAYNSKGKNKSATIFFWNMHFIFKTKHWVFWEFLHEYSDS